MRDGRGERLECSYDMMFFLAFFFDGIGLLGSGYEIALDGKHDTITRAMVYGILYYTHFFHMHLSIHTIPQGRQTCKKSRVLNPR